MTKGEMEKCEMPLYQYNCKICKRPYIWLKTDKTKYIKIKS